MNGQVSVEFDRAELERLLERCIAQRTWGRIRQLRVEVTSERVIVSGYTLLYYIKQLALQVVLETLRASEPLAVEMNVEVGLRSPTEVRS